MKNNRFVFSDLSIQESIGFGSFGSVFTVIDLKGQVYAMKVCPRILDNVNCDFEREILINKLVDHHSFPKFYYSKNFGSFSILIQELCSGSNLNDILDQKEKFNETFTISITKQILDALMYLHQHNIIHRDIKLENIIISDSGEIKICDFGFSRFFEEKLLIDEYCGSHQYYSPEIVLQIPYCGPENDIWTLGICILKMCVGNDFFYEISNGGSITGLYSVFEQKIQSHRLRMVLKSILQVNPENRPSLAQIYSFLSLEKPEIKLFSIKYLDFVIISKMKAMGYSDDKKIQNIARDSKDSILQIYRLLYHKTYKAIPALFNEEELSQIYLNNVKTRNMIFCCTHQEILEFLFYEAITFDQLSKNSGLSFSVAHKKNSNSVLSLNSSDLLFEFELRYRHSGLFSLKLKKIIGSTEEFCETIQKIMTSFNKEIT